MSWDQKRIKDCCTVIGGATPKREIAEYWGGDIPWITPKDISNLPQPVLEDSPEYLTEKGFVSASTYMLPEGAILLTSRAPIGNVAIAGRAMCTNQGFKSLIPGEGMDSRYLYHCMRREAPRLEALGNGATFKEVSKKVVEEFEIPVPPLQEQRRIAAILDKADAIRRKRQQAIELADQFLRSVFLDMFGDPVLNPKGWRRVAFGSTEVGMLDRGKSKHRPRNDPALLGGSHPLIQTGDVAHSGGYIQTYKSTYSDLGLEQSRMWPKGTLCITIAANIAKTGILTFDACFPDSVVGFTPNNTVRVEYVQYWLSFLQKALEAQAPESAQKNINLEILRGLLIPLPDQELQDRFTQLVQKRRSAGLRQFALSQQAETLFSSLSQRAFAGDL